MLPFHTFQASNYRDIETSLVALYAEAFDQTLHIKFSFAKGEIGFWKITRP